MKRFTLLLAVAMALTACAQEKTFDEMVNGLIDRSIPLVQPAELQGQSDVVFLDAREPREYQVSHIPGAIAVGYKKFNLDSVSSVPLDARIVVYCSVGYRSEKIGEKLGKAGFENVSNLYGGLFHWVNTGHDVVQNGEPTRQVHAYNQKWGKWLEEEGCEKVYE